MTSRIGALCFVGLFVGCAAAIGSGCSDDSSKKIPFGEAGEGGEAGAAAGKGGSGGTAGTGGAAGSGAITPEGGAAGEPTAGAAGEGGTPSGEGGAAGAEVGGAPSATAGAAGALACEPSGTTSNLRLNGDSTQQVCRGVFVSEGFTAFDSSATFTCCGVWGGAGPDIEMQGVTVNSGDGTSGSLAFFVPADAPLGMASIVTTCADGVSSRTFDVNVTDTLPPIVQGLEQSTISRGDSLMVDGTNLAGVTRIDVISSDGQDYQCTIDGTQLNYADVTCSLPSDIPIGTYNVIVQQANCGTAANQPQLTIMLPP